MSSATLPAAPLDPGPAADAADTCEWQLPIDGMTCASCVTRVERALRKVPGVVEAEVNLATEQARIVARPGAADRAALAEAVRRTGFSVPDEPAADAGADPAQARPHAAGPWPGEGARVAIAALLSLPLVAPMLAEPFGVHAMLPGWLQWLLA
ncbi:MAG: hypothetical protein RL456_1428, partial [Pseudomonadota bacterium]